MFRIGKTTEMESDLQLPRKATQRQGHDTPTDQRLQEPFQASAFIKTLHPALGWGTELLGQWKVCEARSPKT